ncbi:YitT family protein [Zongyangia hominis]|uniref:YitT family protein n=1 Tax=Zongyangia hominis TaxID=2763677 RepID=A0A926EEU3_9FIRM|nr:YitT family protein [Zongyangia hominis]MBC8570771.1 YitT family protein [Zongyangia hominis]
MAMTKEKWKQEILRYLFMLIGCFFYALCLDLFLVPNHIVGGGVTGLATLGNILFHWNVGTVAILLNIPILLLGLKTQGWVFIVRCFITNMVLGIFTDLFAFLPSITQNPLLAAMYGGLAQGVAIGLFVRFAVSSGGTELLGRVIHHGLPHIGIPTWIAILDGIIVLTGAVVMKNPENVLYALILIFIATKVSDTVITGLNRAKLCYIITERPDEVSRTLLENSPRGVTNLSGKGMYSGTPKGVLLTCVKSHQLVELRRLVRSVDEEAFVIVSETTEVRGKGFESMEEE